MTPRPRAVPLTLDFALLRGAIEEIPFGVATMRGNDVTYANAALERTFGAPPGGLDRSTLSTLFEGNELADIERALDEQRVYDGRLRGKGLDGRAFDAEVHVERYVSASQGTGGFIVVRDVTLELGALGRLVDLLGGAIFRFRVDGAETPRQRRLRPALEYVSPSIGRLTGLEADACCAHPELLLKFVTAEERDRLSFQYRRLAHGDVATVSAQVNLRRPDGAMKLLNLRATGRRDTTGTVRHIEGVVTEAATPLLTAAESEPRPSSQRAPESGPGSGTSFDALLTASESLLRETDQHHQTLGREVRLLCSALSNEEVPSAREASGRLSRITAAATGATVLTRRVRRALRRAAAHVTVSDLCENVRGSLAPSFGEAPLTVVVTPDACDVLLQRRVDELTLTLLHLALRAFRIAGSGSLRLEASLDDARDVCFDLAASGPPAHANEGDSGRSSLFADIAELRETARSLLKSVGGTVLADLRPGPEVRVIIHLPR